MNSYLRNFIIVCSSVMLVCLGCMAFQKALTPAWVDKPAKDYCTGSDGNLPIQMPKLWWTSLADAETMSNLIDYTHIQRQKLAVRMQEDDEAWYQFIRAEHNQNIVNSQQFQNTLFSGENSVAGIAMGMLGLSVGGIAGATLISKPADKIKIAVLEEKVKTNNGKSNGVTV